LIRESSSRARCKSVSGCNIASNTDSGTAEQRLAALGYKQELSRTMSLADVVTYGLIYMVPLAPIVIFGFIYNLSRGMVALVYIVAAVAMYFSAVSYREMAGQFPVAGSVYSYVRFGAGEFPGFVSGWAILLDYLLNPGLLFSFSAAAMHFQFQLIPAGAWIPVFVCVSTYVNLKGIQFTARMNRLCLYLQLAVFAVFVLGATASLMAGQVHLSLAPLYQPQVASLALLFSAIPIAAFSYVGFDAISTLNEEAVGGGRTVARATMIVLFAVAMLFILQVYLGALFVPAGAKFNAAEATTAFYDVAAVAVGPWFKIVITLTSALIAILANAIVAQATTSRLLFSMSRDQRLPAFLSKVNPGNRVPTRAVLVTGLVSIAVGLLAVTESELITAMVTFGSLTAYSLLHIAVMKHFGTRGTRARWFAHRISPCVGLLMLLYTLWSTSFMAKTIACLWLAIGLFAYRSSTRATAVVV
jgi:amino acid transporter